MQLPALRKKFRALPEETFSHRRLEENFEKRAVLRSSSVNVGADGLPKWIFYILYFIFAPPNGFRFGRERFSAGGINGFASLRSTTWRVPHVCVEQSVRSVTVFQWGTYGMCRGRTIVATTCPINDKQTVVFRFDPCRKRSAVFGPKFWGAARSPFSVRRPRQSSRATRTRGVIALPSRFQVAANSVASRRLELVGDSARRENTNNLVRTVKDLAYNFTFVLTVCEYFFFFVDFHSPYTLLYDLFLFSYGVLTRFVWALFSYVVSFIFTVTYCYHVSSRNSVNFFFLLVLRIKIDIIFVFFSKNEHFNNSK